MKVPLRAYWALLVRYLRPRWPQVAALAALLPGRMALMPTHPAR